MVVFLIAFFEAFVGIGLFIPGAVLLSVCTFLYVEDIAGLYTMVPLAFFGALLSDHSGYYIGRYMGPGFHQTRFAVKRAEKLRKAERSINKYGVFAIFIGRFLTPIRSIIPLVIGVTGMQRARYTAFDVMACALWAVCLGLLIVGVDKLLAL